MISSGSAARDQLPPAHRHVREGQGQQGVPAGPWQRRGRPHLFGKGRRPAEGALASAGRFGDREGEEAGGDTTTTVTSSLADIHSSHTQHRNTLQILVYYWNIQCTTKFSPELKSLKKETKESIIFTYMHVLLRSFRDKHAGHRECKTPTTCVLCVSEFSKSQSLTDMTYVQTRTKRDARDETHIHIDDEDLESDL